MKKIQSFTIEERLLNFAKDKAEKECRSVSSVINELILNCSASVAQKKKVDSE